MATMRQLDWQESAALPKALAKAKGSLLREVRFAPKTRWKGRFEECIFEDMEFNAPVFGYEWFGRTVFDRCIFRRTPLGGIAAKCDFQKCRFEQVSDGQEWGGSFREVLFADCDFVGCDFADVTFTAVRLERCRFDDVTMNGTKFLPRVKKWSGDKVTFGQGTSFTDVVMTGRLDEVGFPPSCQFERTDLSACHMHNCDIDAGVAGLRLPDRPDNFFTSTAGLREILTTADPPWSVAAAKVLEEMALSEKYWKTICVDERLFRAIPTDERARVMRELYALSRRHPLTSAPEK